MLWWLYFFKCPNVEDRFGRVPWGIQGPHRGISYKMGLRKRDKVVGKAVIDTEWLIFLLFYCFLYLMPQPYRPGLSHKNRCLTSLRQTRLCKKEMKKLTCTTEYICLSRIKKQIKNELPSLQVRQGPSGILFRAIIHGYTCVKDV